MEKVVTIKDILFNNSKYQGIYSVCSADSLVLEASFRQALEDNSPLLIEATCNQVNQYGGYTGMKPVDFRKFVYTLAEKTGYDTDNLILGGDHLGTQPFSHLESRKAMEKACTMVREYVKAGFSKIHLDASVPCLDDTGLTREELTLRACERSAEMALSIKNLNLDTDISYVIGTEVPTPGGAFDDNEILVPTSMSDAAETIRLSMDSFKKRELDETMENIVALVVQPGVEFSDTQVHSYNSGTASELSCFIKNKDDLVFEAHSTDYQTTAALKNLVEDGFKILKVGPALSYAKRRAMFSLARIESELYNYDKSSNLISVIEKIMISEPDFWKNHYNGDEYHLRMSRQFSFSDRMRYYWTNKEIAHSVEILIKNLRNVEIPQTLIYEFLPELYMEMEYDVDKRDPEKIIMYYIQLVLKHYSKACEFRI